MAILVLLISIFGRIGKKEKKVSFIAANYKRERIYYTSYC